jgi:hypothetical protein
MEQEHEQVATALVCAEGVAPGGRRELVGERDGGGIEGGNQRREERSSDEQ